MYIYRIFFILYLITSWFGAVVADAQNSAYLFHQLSTAKGLTSQNFNFYIQKDQEGFIWISSGDGLNRYDGKMIRPYLPEEEDSLSLSNPIITSNFYEDQKSNIWFSTTETLHRYDRKNDNFERFDLSWNENTYHQSYYLMHIDTAEQHLWLRVEDTLFIKSLAHPEKAPFFRKEYPLNIFSQVMNNPNAPETLLFIPLATGGLRVHRFQKGLEYVRPEEYLNDHKVNCLFYVNDQHCWVGTDSGLIHLDLGQSALPVLHSDWDGRKIDLVNDITQSGPYEYIIATQKKGLYVFDSRQQLYTSQFCGFEAEKMVPFTPEIERIYLDQDRTLWVSTGGKGVFFTNLDKKRFQAVLQSSKQTDEQSSFVRSITEDQSGELWCLTRNGVIVLDSIGKPSRRWANVFTGSHVPFHAMLPYFIHCDEADRIWVATQGGLYLLGQNRESFHYVPIRKPETAPSPVFTHVTSLSDQSILASSTSGIYRPKQQNGIWTIEKAPEIKKNDQKFTWIYELPDRQLLLLRVMEKSFQVYENGSGRLQYLNTIPFEPWVNYMTEDKDRKLLWIASAEGLYKMDLTSDSLEISREEGFNYKTLNGLLQDEKSGRLWISTNRGLIRYDPNTKDIQIYGPNDGIQANEFNFWSAKKTSSGKMTFGGVNGLNIFQPEAIQNLPAEASPVITSLLINDEKPEQTIICDKTGARNLEQMKKITLSYQQNTLSFRFAALEYSDPVSNSFRYRMTNVDDNWVESGPENFARYPNLAHGHYTFQLKASNSDQRWSKKIATLEIFIRPPWYLSWWAKMLALIALGLSIYVIYRFRIKQVRREEAVKRRLLVFRQKEAEYKQQVAETETAVRRLQMNPHFIFNSMTSIKSYILEKDIDTAGNYLNRFARLMRKILQYGDKPFITVSQEIELLKGYLQTEAMRFENKYDYQIEIDDGLEPDEVILPTMLLQPFVENAILHGIRHKVGKGLIQIRFWLENNKLYASVEDDGIGRLASEKLKRQAEQPHDSQAVAITQRRLNLLQSQEGDPPSIQIIDLHNDDGQATGTCVQLSLPLL